jgi:hypothetical protein
MPADSPLSVDARSTAPSRSIKWSPMRSALAMIVSDVQVVEVTGLAVTVLDQGAGIVVEANGAALAGRANRSAIVAHSLLGMAARHGAALSASARRRHSHLSRVMRSIDLRSVSVVVDLLHLVR